MNLGETIYRLRTEKNMSQGDLADALDVSRQSVSKWENGNAVPDLEKLIKLSELFGITLDELVGRAGPRQPEVSGTSATPETPPRISVQKIVGIILLCTGFLFLLYSLSAENGSVVISQLLLAVLFVLCGTVCLKFQKHAGFVCSCVLYLFTWFPAGVLSTTYIMLDFARGIQLAHILWGVSLGIHGNRVSQIGHLLQKDVEKFLFLAILILTVLISFTALLFPGLLPTPELLAL